MTMFLLTIFNPFLTRGLRSTGFEGVHTEICLIQHVQTKTDSMHADRVLGDVSWMRGKCPKHECRPQQADVNGFELQLECAARQDGGAVLFLLKSPRAHALLSAFRPRAMSMMGLSRSLSRVQHTNPGLARSQDKAHIEVRAPQAHRQRVEP